MEIYRSDVSMRIYNFTHEPIFYCSIFRLDRVEFKPDRVCGACNCLKRLVAGACSALEPPDLPFRYKLPVSCCIPTDSTAPLMAAADLSLLPWGLDRFRRTAEAPVYQHHLCLLPERQGHRSFRLPLGTLLPSRKSVRPSQTIRPASGFDLLHAPIVDLDRGNLMASGPGNVSHPTVWSY